jgi:hypothetical protein
MEYVYHIVTIRVNETSWAYVWRLHSRYLRTGYDTRELTGAWPPAPPGLNVTGEGAEDGESGSGNPLGASPKDGRRRGGRATEGNGGGSWCSVRWWLRTRERAKEGGGECGDGRGCSSPFYSGRGRARRGEEGGNGRW